MKTANDKLYFLIKSMTKGEKRYFHQYAKKKKASLPNYWLLYEQISHLTSWDNELLLLKLENYSFSNDIAVVKHQLYDKLLDALHLYHCSQDQEEKIKRRLHQAYLLLKRGLNEQSEALLRKTLQQIEQLEFYWLLPEALRLSGLLIENKLRLNDQSKNLKNLDSAWKKGIEQLDNYHYFRSLKLACYQQHFHTSSATRPSDIAKQNTLPLSLIAKAEQLQWLALSSFMNNDTALAYHYNEQQLNVLEQLLASQRGAPERFLSVLYNMLIDQLQLGRLSDFKQGLIRLRKLPQEVAFKNLKNIEAKIFEWGYQLELNQLIGADEMEHAKEHLPSLLQGLHKHEKQMSKPARVGLYHLGGLIAFHTNAYQLALTFLTPLHQEKPDLRQPINRASHLLFLLTHFSAANYLLLENLINNTKRTWNQLEDKSAGEMLFLKQLSYLVSIHHNKSLLNSTLLNWANTYQDDSLLERFLLFRKWLVKVN